MDSSQISFFKSKRVCQTFFTNYTFSLAPPIPHSPFSTYLVKKVWLPLFFVSKNQCHLDVGNVQEYWFWNSISPIPSEVGPTISLIDLQMRFSKLVLDFENLRITNWWRCKIKVQWNQRGNQWQVKILFRKQDLSCGLLIKTLMGYWFLDEKQWQEIFNAKCEFFYRRSF